jgi:phenylacetate-CoA ligase
MIRQDRGRAGSIPAAKGGAVADFDPSETWTDTARRAAQRERLARMLPAVLAANPFYRAKLGPSASVDTWAEVPFTTKQELSADQAAHPPFGSNLTEPVGRYVRLHHTSGTTGTPLRILDTAGSWEWWKETWRFIYRAAGVTAADRVFFCFSFGPFIGFWSAFAGAEHLGALSMSGGAMSSSERVAAILATRATVLVCTPTYALRLAEVARDLGVDLSASALRVSVHAGEPGASIPETRSRIEAAFGVTAFDHTGATEIGPSGFSCEARDGVHLIEREFIAEIRAEDGRVTDDGEGELVLTNLGRWCSPAIRYRTGDRVRAVRSTCACGRTLVKLEGGILGRVDDMLTVRGVNVFPSALEGIVRRFDDVVEFRIEAYIERGMDALRCTIEPRAGVDAEGLSRAVADAIHRDIGIGVVISVVEPGSLPRFEQKAGRFTRRRGSEPV